MNEADTARPERQPRRAPRPLTPARLEEMALAYVARFATSAGKLETYLARKLMERGWEGEGDGKGEGRAAIAAIIARFESAGYVDDESFARMRSGSLLRRGYGQRRIAQDLNAAGIAESIRHETAPDEAAVRRAIVALARRKGLGPFTRGRGEGALDPALREKQMAAMLRAGHPMGPARALLAMESAGEAESWVEEAQTSQDGALRGFWD